MKRNSLIIITAIVIAGLIAGIALMGGGSDDTNTTSTQQPSSNEDGTADNQAASDTSVAPSSTDTVIMKDNSFTPATITVKQGTKVTWTNQDSVVHNVKADSGIGPDSPTLQNGDTYSFTYDTVGTFTYNCTFHSGMNGTVIVTE